MLRSNEYLDARNGMNRAPKSSQDQTVRSFENQLMGTFDMRPKHFLGTTSGYQ
jgi:hypothetical protein